MDPRREELGALTRLSVPIVLSNLGGQLMHIVDMMMVGHLSKTALAAATISGTWTFGTGILGMGLVMGMDPIVTQAHGRRDGAAAGLALQRGTLIGLAAGLVIGLLWLFTERFLLFAGQDPTVAHEAHRYTVVQIPTYWCFLVFLALRQYLQGREIVKPVLWVTLAANVFNVVFNGCWIYGWFGIPALGLTGAGIATAASRLMLLVMLLVVVRRRRLHEGAWTPWSRSSFAAPGLWRVVLLGAPVGIQMGLEFWAFGFSQIMSGWLGELELAAHGVVVSLAALSFMVPMGVSGATCTRIGNLIGEVRHARAQLSAWTGFALGAAIMTFFALVFALARDWLPRAFTDDLEVIVLAASILPIAATFQVFDGVQVVGAGILRAMGDTRPAAWFNLLGYWMLSLPLAYWMAFRLGWGLAGVWWGLVIGLFVVAICLMAWVRRRGPAQLAPL